MARRPSRRAKPASAGDSPLDDIESEFYSDQSALGHAATNADEEMMTLQHAIRRWDDSPTARIASITRTSNASKPGWLITGQR
jgi:hypothetical protein